METDNMKVEYLRNELILFILTTRWQQSKQFYAEVLKGQQFKSSWIYRLFGNFQKKKIAEQM